MPHLSIEQLRSIGEIATLVDWRLEFIETPKCLSPAVDLSELLDFRCESADLPKATITSTEITVRGHKIKQAGIMGYSNQIVLTLYEDADSTVSELIRRWREASYQTNTGRQMYKVDTEAVVKLTRMDRNGANLWEYVLIGVYLEDYDPGGQLGGTSADAVKPTMTLSYDYFMDGRAGSPTTQYNSFNNIDY